MKKNTDYTIHLLIALFLFACFASSCNDREQGDDLTGKVGKYTIDLPEEIGVTDGRDVLVKVSGDSIILYFDNNQYSQ